MHYDVIIVGAGPGGLACAEITAAKGLKTLVLERKLTIGKKVCAGGITWNGLIKRIPDDISERQFSTQHIFSRWQKISLTASTPIIATVSREKLGRRMHQNALQAGAEIRLGCQLTSISGNEISYLDKKTRERRRQSFRYLVGADGSSSLVRRHLGIPVSGMGIGINYQLPGHYSEMEWHLDCSLFASGYSWVFPHQATVSVGAYADARVISARQLQANLLQWGQRAGYPLSGCRGEADFVNFDYRGYSFGNIRLVGDAAGLASGLTGEGIYPAIVSGEAVARSLVDPLFHPAELNRLIKNHARHRRMVTVLGKNKFLSTFLAELVTFCLKKKIINFSAAEMAH